MRTRSVLLACLALVAVGLLFGAVVPRLHRAPESPSPAALVRGSRVPGPTAAEEGYPTFEAAPPPRTPVQPPTAAPPSPSPPPSPPPRERAPRRRPTPAPLRERETPSRASKAAPAPPAAPGAGESGQDTSPTISSPGAATVSGSTPGPTAPAASPPEPAAETLPSIAATPILTPPVPLETPPLDPVLRATIIAGPDGQVAAGEASVRGKLRVRLLIRADGTVARVEVLTSSGDPDLDEAARRGLLTWRFSPALRDGVPIDAYFAFWVAFRD